jgi:hypothetical protein
VGFFRAAAQSYATRLIATYVVVTASASIAPNSAEIPTLLKR